MGHPLLLYLWCALSVVGLATSQALIECSDEPTCKNVRVLAQNRQDIESVFRDNQAIREADLSGNLLKQFPAGVLRIANQLQSLNLSYNLLEDDVLRDAWNPQLQHVDLTYNQLTGLTVPTSLRTLRAVRNRLSRLSVPRNSNLKELILSMNQFESLNDFTNLKSLSELDLSCNQIREVSLDILSSMDSLVYLNLANNHIHALVGSSSLPKLEYLDLSNNIITFALFSEMPKLKRLFIQNNKIVMTTNNLVLPNLQVIDASVNDWDCKKLKTLLDAHGRVKSTPDTSGCPDKSVENICCTESMAPFADRLIKYHKDEFYALTTGTKQRENGYSCKDYTPSPCDGDDNLVYKVAGAAAQDVQTLTKSSLQRLLAELRRSENLLNMDREKYLSYNDENLRMEASLNELIALIEAQHTRAGLSTEGVPLAKLKAVLEQYELNQKQMQQLIDGEERTHKDHLREITDIQGQLEDLEYSQEMLQNDYKKRNTTVTGLRMKNNEMLKQLDARKLN